MEYAFSNVSERVSHWETRPCGGTLLDRDIHSGQGFINLKNFSGTNR